ncbi:MAG: TonB-dependent receptor [Candidatus Synoicihabitans palmerolidicus]|nr:TonB-dependent receptor [Candidatus Synoicihabitans palmerolidicus]
MQHADRRDLSVGATPNDRLIPTFSGERSWSLNEDSQVSNLGVFWQGAINASDCGIVAGARLDSFDVNTISNGDCSEGTASSSDTESAFNIGINYHTTSGLVPYLNYSRSIYLLNDSNGGTYNAAIVSIGDHLQDAELKASLLEDKLYAALAYYQQDRARADMFGNPIQLESAGTEFELRYAPTARFSLTAAAAWQTTILMDENLFIRLSLVEVNRLMGTNISPADYYGGVSETTIEFIDMPTEFEAPGQPNEVFSLYGTYTWASGFGLTTGATYVPAVSSGFFDHVKLPSYLLVNSTLFYAVDNWSFSLRVRNVLDEQYFTSQVFWDDLLVLPSEGRTYDCTISYDW